MFHSVDIPILLINIYFISGFLNFMFENYLYTITSNCQFFIYITKKKKKKMSI